MRTVILAIFAVLTLTGCDSGQIIGQRNEFSLKHPVIIGQTEDGLTIKEYEIIAINDSNHKHFIYVVGNTVTENHKERVGKYIENRVTVFSNGVPIQPELSPR